MSRSSTARPAAAAEARRRLEEADSYWLATVRPDCAQPHVMAVLGCGWMGRCTSAPATPQER
jgi:hypothetical protein